MPGMTVSLAGLLTHAANELDRLHRLCREMEQEQRKLEYPDPDEDEELSEADRGQAEYYIFCLRETAANCQKATKGEETLEEFGRFYLGLKPKPSDLGPRSCDPMDDPATDRWDDPQ